MRAAWAPRICKNLFLCNRQKTEFYLLLLPGDKPFQTKIFSKLIGVSRLSFADADAMLHYLDITPGSVSILGLMNDREKALHVYIDREVASDPWLGAHPCIDAGRGFSAWRPPPSWIALSPGPVIPPQ